MMSSRTTVKINMIPVRGRHRGPLRRVWRRFSCADDSLTVELRASRRPRSFRFDMIHKLRQFQSEGRRIRVGIIGCGAMGIGVAWQVARTPGMEVVFLGDISDEVLERAARATGLRQLRVENPESPPDRAAGSVLTTTDSLALLRKVKVDVMVECTSVVFEAAQYCLAAIDQGAHVVLMNAEVDLVFGPLLAHEARRQGVVVTSDAGDQHGVLATMADEILLWGFRIVQAGNMKGFLHRHADADYARPWAEKQKGSVVQTVSYTDGTKMNVEQALIGNYLGLIPTRPGMEGPKCSDLRQVLEVFDFDSYGDQGRVDYTVGVPWPGGGVYIVGWCDDDQQDFLLNYYRVTSRRPYYLFFRPYHLCHVETPRAIAQAFFDARPVIRPPLGPKLNDLYAYAKRDLAPGTTVHHAIGGDEVYGMIDACAKADPARGLPLALLEPFRDGSGTWRRASLKRARKRDEPLALDDVDIPDTPHHQLLARQTRAIAG
jgi:predicted homoserine dehydrogenase-like protein